MAASTAPRIGASATSTIQLEGDAFATGWNEHLVWHVVRNEMLWRRQGTHSVKSRGQVAGGGAKPWRQKGTGRARQGTTRAPQWRTGGVVFGPTPRSYGGKVNRKERRRAMFAALTQHAERGSIAVLADDAFGEVPSTKRALELRAGLRFEGHERRKGRGKVTIVCTADQLGVWKSFRNLADVMVVADSELDVADVMWGRGLVITDAALERITATGSTSSETEGEGS